MVPCGADGRAVHGHVITHKGLQRTANEYAGERGIYKDLISKNEKETYYILQAEYCNADRTT